MYVNIVIPTYNSESSLRALIRSINKQNISSLPVDQVTVTIIDDSSHPPITSELQHDTSNLFKTSIIRHESNMGRACARNTGIYTCESEYTLFLDCDCEWTNSNSLEQFIHEAKKGKTAIFGRLTAEDTEFWGKYFNLSQKRKETGSLDAMVTTNCLLKTSYLRQIGGFCSEYKGYGFEDKDLLLRLKPFLEQSQISYLDTVPAKHRNFDTLKNYCDKQYQSAKTSAKLFSSHHPEAYMKSVYSKIDYRYMAFGRRYLLYLLMPLSSQLMTLTEKLIQNRRIPFKLKLNLVKASAALQYFKGSLYGANKD